MKELKITLIVVLSVVVLGLCALLSYSLSKRGSDQWEIIDGNAELVQEKEFPAADIDKLDIRYDKSGNDVTIYESDGNTVIVREFANYEVKDSGLAEIKLSDGGTLSVRGPKRVNNMIHFNRYMYTEIWLPAGYEGEISVATVSGEIRVERELSLQQKLKLSSTSGDIATKGITASQISVTSTSGEVRTGELAAKEIEIATTSGDVRVDKADGRLSVASNSGEVIISDGSGERKVSTTSGDIRISGADGMFSLSSTSGEILLEGQSGFGTASATSGDIRISVAQLAGDLDVDTSSGEVTLGLSENESMQFKVTTTSGVISTFFDDVLSFSRKGNRAEGSIGDDSNNKVTVTTTSGDIRVRKM